MWQAISFQKILLLIMLAYKWPSGELPSHSKALGAEQESDQELPRAQLSNASYRPATLTRDVGQCVWQYIHLAKVLLLSQGLAFNWQES